TLGDRLDREQAELLERRRQDDELGVGDRPRLDGRSHDRARQAELTREQADDALVARARLDDARADRRLVEIRPRLDRHRLADRQAAPAVGRLLLLPAERREESLGERLVTDLPGELHDRGAVARANETLEHLRVLLAVAEPLLDDLRVAPRRRGAQRSTEVELAVDGRDRLELEELTDPQEQPRVELSTGL